MFAQAAMAAGIAAAFDQAATVAGTAVAFA